MMSTFAYDDPMFDEISPLLDNPTAHDGGHPSASQNSNIHPAVLAAIAMGCITAFFALVTWSMNICILLGRVRRQEKARNAQEVPSGPTTVEPRLHEHIGGAVPAPDPVVAATASDSVRPPARAARRSGPVASAGKVVPVLRIQDTRDRKAVPSSSVTMLLPALLALILGCFHMIRRWVRRCKPGEERHDCWPKPRAFITAQLDTLPKGRREHGPVDAEPIPIVQLDTRLETLVPRVTSTTPEMYDVHIAFWVSVWVAVIGALICTCWACIGLECCFRRSKTRKERRKAVSGSDIIDVEQTPTSSGVLGRGDDGT
ncbi:hypothetical protein CTA2_9120 [Colletotrichum tanaceti]|nr:hypothetical protein CTA2_9120 [Colletotrichum tanaceti]